MNPNSPNSRTPNPPNSRTPRTPEREMPLTPIAERESYPMHQDERELEMFMRVFRIGYCALLMGGLSVELQAQRNHSRGGSATSRGDMRRSGSASILPYAKLIYWYAEQFRVDAALVAAVMKCESDGNPYSYSGSGAMGLMQLMPGTCGDFGVLNPYDPSQNIAGGTALLARNLRRYHGDMTNAVAAYNAGPRHADDGSWRQINETRKYVPAVLARYNEFRTEGWATFSDNYYAEPSNPEPSNPEPTDLPPSAPPLPINRQQSGPSVNPADMMFEVVGSTQSATESHAVGENPVLEEAAEAAMQAFQTGNTDNAQLQSKVEKFLSHARFTTNSVKVFAFRSSSLASFPTTWSQQPKAAGRFVGLAHGLSGQAHLWVVIVAAK